jgi:hypothetical protein
VRCCDTAETCSYEAMDGDGDTDGTKECDADMDSLSDAECETDVDEETDGVEDTEVEAVTDAECDTLPVDDMLNEMEDVWDNEGVALSDGVDV